MSEQEAGEITEEEHKEEYLELVCALENDNVDTSLSTLFYRERRMREIEEEYGADITDKWVDDSKLEG